ncbi:MAG: hypothetical protein J5574_00600 [Lachnospiraceae bacterium]|nr:hypothetical protein [Lachnospiraceae bacterium]
MCLIDVDGRDKFRFREMIGVIGNYIASLKSDGNEVNRWIIYSAAVICCMSKRPTWQFSESEIREVFGDEVTYIAYQDQSWKKVFTFAASLVEARERVYGKVTGARYDEGLVVETTPYRETRLRKAADDLENSQRSRIKEYNEYNALLDRLFRDSYRVWKVSHETGYDELGDFLMNLPDRMIIHKRDAYVVQEVTEYTEMPVKGLAGDYNTDSYESGLKVRLTKCVGGEELIIKIKDVYKDQIADVILKGNMLRIPDKLTRDMIKELS